MKISSTRLISVLLHFLGMNQFGQMGMQSMGQRSTPPLPLNAPVNQVGVTVTVHFTDYIQVIRDSRINDFPITLVLMIDDIVLLAVSVRSASRRVNERREKKTSRGMFRCSLKTFSCLISRWVWEQQGWVSPMPHSYRTSTSLQASSPGPVQDAVLVRSA